ncbi:hypothetical protein SGRIM128S_02071 [Streptomyces griseomycini]|nr:hypothetical protein GCM10015536_46980 [Streptomyces griseomycini]
MPPEAHARTFSRSCPGSGPSTSDPGPVPSAYTDAMADRLPRSPGTAVATGRATFAGLAARHVLHPCSAGPA